MPSTFYFYELLCAVIVVEQGPDLESPFRSCCTNGICELGRDTAFCRGPRVPAASTVDLNISVEADECMCDLACIQ